MRMNTKESDNANRFVRSFVKQGAQRNAMVVDMTVILDLVNRREINNCLEERHDLYTKVKIVLYINCLSIIRFPYQDR